MRYISVVLLSLLAMQSSLYAKCYHRSCDGSISYAMGKHRAALSLRLGDYSRTIRATARSVQKDNKLCALGVYEKTRLIQRKRIEALKEREISFTSSLLKEAEATHK